jgi:glycosyltransferase involved in cell wall biosynthesis
VKLLFYSHYFAPSIGGVETIVLSLASGLAELRAADGAPEFEVTLVTQTPKRDFDDWSLPFPVVRSPGAWKLWNLVRQAEVVHLAGPSFLPMLFAWTQRKPYVVEHHTYQAICPNGLLIHQPDRNVCPGHFQAGAYRQCVKCELAENSFARAMVKVIAAFPRRALVRRASRNIAVSGHVQRRIALPRTEVVLHGIEGESETQRVHRDDQPAAEPRIARFVFVGRFVAEKGLTVFLDAMETLSREGFSFEALLVGDGPDRAAAEGRLASSGLLGQIQITGFLSRAQLALVMNDKSAIVMPSVWEEPAGLAAMEQMMRGRPVVVSRIGGLAEIVADAGLQFRAGDAADLARCLRKLLREPSFAVDVGVRAKKRAGNFFSQEKMIQEHASIYRTVQGRRLSG